jgi:uncharacterized protein
MWRPLSRLSLIVIVLPITIVNPSVSLAKAPTAKAVLWEISGNGLKRPSYLLGTRHVGCAKRLALSPEQDQALKKVEQVYLEVDEKELNSVNNTPQATGERRTSDGKGLKERLTPSEYQFVEDHIGKISLDSFVSSGTSVFSLYTIISSNLGVKVYDRFCKGSSTSKESIIMKAATDRQLPMLGIETRAISF